MLWSIGVWAAISKMSTFENVGFWHIVFLFGISTPDISGTVTVLFSGRTTGEFSIQHGASFGFGTKANDSTGNLFKLSAARATVKEKLIQASIDNLNEERSVRFIAHLVSIWGPDQCKPTSKKEQNKKDSE